MAADDVSLPDLEVIAQFSLAVRAATAPRAQVVAALEADLRALTGSGRPGSRSAAPEEEPRRRAVPRPGSIQRAPAEAAPEAGDAADQTSAEPAEPPATAARKVTAARKAPATRSPGTPARKAAAKAPAKAARRAAPPEA